MKNIYKLILSFVSVLILSAFLIVPNSFAYSSFPLNDAECDELIRLTYRDWKSRSNPTIYNTQVCLSMAGYFNHGGKFTTYYGPVTEQAALAYIDARDNPRPTISATAPVNSSQQQDKAAQDQLKLELEKKLKNAEADSQSEKEAENNLNQQSSNQQLSATNSAPADSNLSGTNSAPINEVATIDRQPQTADRIIINSIYFLVSLPFILFALSVIMAFLKVFKKKKENIEY